MCIRDSSIAERSDRHLWLAGIRWKYTQKRPVQPQPLQYLSGAGAAAWADRQSGHSSDSRGAVSIRFSLLVLCLQERWHASVFRDVDRAQQGSGKISEAVSYTHLRAHETPE